MSDTTGYSVEYKMMLESFMENIKSQDDELVDGGLLVFIPANSTAAQASILSWLPEHSTKDAGRVWHEMFVSILWTLLQAEIPAEILHEIVDYAAHYVDNITSKDVVSMFNIDEVN